MTSHEIYKIFKNFFTYIFLITPYICIVGVDKRRDHVSELQQEEETFQEDLVEVSRLISELENLTTQEITDVSVEKCEQLASTYQVGIFGSGMALVFIRILENLVFKCEEMLNY